MGVSDGKEFDEGGVLIISEETEGPGENRLLRSAKLNSYILIM